MCKELPDGFMAYKIKEAASDIHGIVKYAKEFGIDSSRFQIVREFISEMTSGYRNSAGEKYGEINIRTVTSMIRKSTM